MLDNRREVSRERRKARVRKKILGTDGCPRVCVFRSNKHLYAQVISDQRGVTLAAVSTLSRGFAAEKKEGGGVDMAKRLGLALAKVCKEKNITRVVFDRNGFLYHGKVKALAEGARQGGLEF